MTDSTPTLVELTNTVRRFCEERDWDQYHNAKELAIGICTESGELLEQFRFKSTHETEQLMRDPKGLAAVSEEMADVLFFLLRLSQRYNIDLASALDKKIQLNATRYPVETSRGSNKKYSELETSRSIKPDHTGLVSR